MFFVVKNTLFLDVIPSGSSKNRRFAGMYHLYYKGERNQRAKNNVSSK
jgi:hypothetical protein